MAVVLPFRDGEQELIESMLRSESPESKLLLGLLSGSIITAGALVVCWLSGSSPAGMSLISQQTASARREVFAEGKVT